MASNLNIFRDNAINKITLGKNNYNSGNTFEIKKEGYSTFKQGVLELNQYMKMEPNDILKKTTYEKVNMFLAELESMKAYLEQYANQYQGGQWTTPTQQNNTFQSIRPVQNQQPFQNPPQSVIRNPSNEERKEDYNTGSRIKGQAQTNQNTEQDKLKANLESSIVSEKPNIKWDDVAGLENAKKSLQEAVILPIKFPEIFQGARKPWMGILLYGPPGTGKTFLAKACATEADGTFFSVSSSDLISKFVGESERLIKSLFQMARDRKPSIIFIDEIDSMCGSRDGNENEASRRVKTEFLVQMQGVGNNNDGVLVLGATNLPWALDPAIRRRFEKRVYIPLPEHIGRQSLLQNRLKDTPNNISEQELQDLVNQLDGYSGSDLNTLVRDASFEPLRRCQNAKYFKQITTPDGIKYSPCPPSDQQGQPMTMFQLQTGQLFLPPLEIDDFFSVLPKCKPSVCKDDLGKYEDWTKQFGQDG